MSEDLTTYMKEAGIKVNYLHSEIKTLKELRLFVTCEWAHMMQL